MQNHILDDYLDAVQLQLRHLPLAEQRQVLAQVRDHLEEDIRGRRGEDKKLSADEAALQATHGFGDPHDLGVAYGARGGVVRKSTGEVLLHVAVLTGRGVARTVGKTLKWTAIALASLLLLGAVVFVALAIAYQPTIEKGLDKATSYDERILVHRAESHERDTAVFTDSFSITERTVSSDFHVRVTPSSATGSPGCAAIVITGPGDSKVYDSTGNCGPQDFRSSLTMPGAYTIEYRLVGFTGVVSVTGTALERID